MDEMVRRKERQRRNANYILPWSGRESLRREGSICGCFGIDESGQDERSRRRDGAP